MIYLIENNNKPKNVTEIHYLQKVCEKPTPLEVGDSVSVAKVLGFNQDEISQLAKTLEYLNEDK